MTVVAMEKQQRGIVAQEKLIEVGVSGLKQWGGVLDEEFLRELRDISGVRIFREMARNDAIVGASLFAYITLAKEVTFRLESAAQGDALADEITEFVRGALFEDMSTSWRDLLGEIFSFLTYGWSWFEVVYKRRGGDVEDSTHRSRFTDGRIGWRKWAIRGQDTLVRWELDEHGGIQAMVQRASPTFEELTVPIEKSLLFRTLIERNNPEGMSILRTAYQSFYYKRRIQVVRGIGIERDLAGLPMITPPEAVDLWNPNDSDAVAKKAAAEKVVRRIRRDEHEGVVLPFGWTLELLASSGSRQFDITAVIAQLNAEIAMSMMTDFLLLGHEKVGARALASDKRAVFSHAAASFLDTITDVINRFAIPELVKLNGWPMELSPKLKHGPVAEIELTELTTFIEKAAGAGLLFPDEELEAHLRTRAMLPPPPEDRPPMPNPDADEED
jgi:hypothetical protein|tara:strand:- start:35285 stop:36613 length:1329 start_codon:yes stop_codon:yes gene_type:complete